MNLSEALDAALPEIPKSRLQRTRPPRLDPNLVVRDDFLDGEPIVAVFQRERGNFFRFPPNQWKLALLFDGIRTYPEIAAIYSEQCGSETDPEEVRQFAEGMDGSSFWHKTSQEKNLAMSERLSAQRGRRAERKSKINLAHISFSAWDPDTYFTWLDRLAGRFIYSKWSVLAVVLLFCFEAVVFLAKWNVIGPDIPVYYNFSRKSFYDFAEFWVLLFVLGFVHESAHGLTCKHFGGQVHQMGLMLLYMTPAFFVDVTESWVSATRIQRLGTIIAGIWVEMVVCGLAMIVWLNTASGLWIHEFTYKVILITGVAVIVMNLNPLLKLDGYYFFTEAIGIPDLKERSTAFVSGWFQRYILRLPVEVPAIPRKRAPLFAIYALVSGGYSYMVLFFFLRFTYNVSSKLLAEFALIPVAALGFVMFKARLRSLRSTIKEIWNLHFSEGVRLRPLPVLVALLVLAIVFVPIWRDREGAYFVIEGAQQATLHAAVSGRIDAVWVKEGEAVRKGQPLLQMSSVAAAEMRSGAEAETSAADYQAFESELHGQSIGAASANREAAARSTTLAQDAQSKLLIQSPVDGVVLTLDPAALRTRAVVSGQSLLTLAGDGPHQVRVFIPASELDRIPKAAEVALALPGQFSILRLPLGPMYGAAVSLPAGLIPTQDYRGVELPAFYSARMMLGVDAANLPLGIGGHAQIFGERRSLFARCASVAINLFHAHVW